MSDVPTLPRAARAFVTFVALLRANGFAIAPEQTTSFLAAIELLGPREPRGHPAGGPRDAGAAARAARGLRSPVPHPFPRRARRCLAPRATTRRSCGCRRSGRGEDEPPARRRSQRIRRNGGARRRRWSSAASDRGGDERRAAPPGARGARAPAATARPPAHARAARARSRTCAARCARAARNDGEVMRLGRLKRRSASAQDAAADRRLRLDEGAHRGQSAARPCAGAGGAAGRGLHLRHAADARHARAAAQAPRAGARRPRRISSATGTAARASATRCRPFSPCRASPATPAAPRSLVVSDGLERGDPLGACATRSQDCRAAPGA